MTVRDELLGDARARLAQAQDVYKKVYNKHHREVHYAVGEWVWLHVRHRSPASLQGVTKGKLRPHYYWPYRIAAIINEVAYRLELSAGAKLHNVFHVGLLKKFVGTQPTSPPALPPTHHGATQPVPERATRTRLARGVHQVLIQWQGEPAVSATWEDLEDFQDRYPAFQLEDELLVEGGDMSCGAGTTAGGLNDEQLARPARPRIARSSPKGPEV
jgi:hypothetical protein